METKEIINVIVESSYSSFKKQSEKGMTTFLIPIGESETLKGILASIGLVKNDLTQLKKDGALIHHFINSPSLIIRLNDSFLSDEQTEEARHELEQEQYAQDMEAEKKLADKCVEMHDALVKSLKDGLFNSETLLATFGTKSSCAYKEVRNQISDMRELIRKAEKIK